MQQWGGNVEQGTGARRCCDRDGDLEWKGMYGVGGRKDICLGVSGEVYVLFLAVFFFFKAKTKRKLAYCYYHGAPTDPSLFDT